MKLGVSLGTGGGYLRNVGGTARATKARGFAGPWSSETKHDAFLPLAIAANESSTGRSSKRSTTWPWTPEDWQWRASPMVPPTPSLSA